MGTAHLHFDKRVGHLQRKRRKMARNGIVQSVNHDGLIIVRARRRTPRFPLRGLAMLFFAIFAFKTFLFMTLGERVYDQRVALLSEGSFAEQAGGWVMQADPLTVRMAGLVKTLLP